MDIKRITLKPTTVKFIEINPCGASIRLANGSYVSGMKPVPTKTNVGDISKLVRCGVKVNELPGGISSATKVPLYPMNADKVFSEEHLECLKKINIGYIDVAEEIFAGNKAGSLPVLRDGDPIPNSTNDVVTSQFAWSDSDKVVKVLTDSTVTNREQLINDYSKNVMIAIARRTAEASDIAEIIGKFKAIDIESLNTRIATFVSAMETAIKKDIYSKTVEIPEVETIVEETSEESVAEETEIVEETVVEETEVVEEVTETEAPATEEPVAEETETVENAEEAPKQSNVPSNANKRRNRKH